MSKYAKLLEWRKNNAVAISKAIAEVSGDDLSILLENRGLVFSELYADHVTAQQQAEIARLNAAAVVDAARIAELERELDGLSNSYATCGKPDCTPTQVCELFFNGCRS